MLRLLLLEKEVQEMLERGSLSAGHARALLGLEGPQQVAAAQKVQQEGLSVRQTESFIKNLMQKAEIAVKEEKVSEETTSPEEEAINAILLDVEESLREALGTQVRIKGSTEQIEGTVRHRRRLCHVSLHGCLAEHQRPGCVH
jgi:ParB family chromosome partitioning protein